MTRGHRGGVNAEGTILDHITTYITPNVYTYREWMAAGEPDDCVVRNVPYTTVYGTQGRTEFVIIWPGDKTFPWNESTRVEVKWQSSSGSVDEKFPYLVENIGQFPEPEVVIVAAGGGAKPKAVEWLAEAAASMGAHTGKTVIVMTSTDEFGVWAHRWAKTRGL